MECGCAVQQYLDPRCRERGMCGKEMNRTYRGTYLQIPIFEVDELPMSTPDAKIERVARAMQNADRVRAATWEDESEGNRWAYRQMAIAAIEALRADS